MIKKFCDKCKEEIVEQDFRCEVIIIEIKQTFLPHQNNPQLFKKELHLCQKCYRNNLNL